MRGLTAPLVKSIIFVVVTVLATGLLAITIANGSGDSGSHYSAIFSNATSLNDGDDVRMAGVRVGQVSSISIVDERLAKVDFTLSSAVHLASTTTATLRFRNLIGQRYIELDEGSGPLSSPLANGATIPLARTHPALDLTVLFDGFQPLFQALNPTQVNDLSGEIIQVFQGEGPTINNLLTQTASLTQTLAGKDKLIGDVIDNLNAVLATVNQRGHQLKTLITSLQQLVSGLSADRAALGDSLTGVSHLTSDVSSLLRHGRAPLKATIDNLGQLSKNLADSTGSLNSFLETLPTKLNTIGRTASYGSWLNFYECSFTGRIPKPKGYFGGVGAQPVAARCGR